MPDSNQTIPVHHGSAFWPHLFAPLKQMGGAIADFFSPDADASNTEDAYEINIELPGVNESDIDVSLTDDILTITGEKRVETEKKGRSYYFSERSYGAFERSFRLPDDVDADGLEAAFADGLLTLRLPRTAKLAAQARKIEIRHTGNRKA